MPKAIEVAKELRRVADALESAGDTEIQIPWLWFYCSEKDAFLNTARAMPHPLKKEVKYPDDPGISELRVVYRSDALDLEVSVPRAKVCTIVEPAKPAVYDCVKILSDEEFEGVRA